MADHAGGPAAAAVLMVTHICADAGGDTRFEQFSVPLDDSPMGLRSEVLSATGVRFWRTTAERRIDLHPAGARQWVVVQTGTIEIGSASGAVVTLRPGDVALADDRRGTGHSSYCAGPTTLVMIPVPDNFEPEVFKGS